jgi:two-component system, chemotaxis family, chemotaxis protein CheY
MVAATFVASMSARILIVDDSAFARRTLRRMLEEQGYGVEEARNGVEAIEKYTSNRPDVVFLDIVMEGMEGLEVLRKLRDVDATAKVVMATADVQTSTRNEAMSAGASALVNKPFQAKEVTAVVRGLQSDVP